MNVVFYVLFINITIASLKGCNSDDSVTDNSYKDVSRKNTLTVHGVSPHTTYKQPITIMVSSSSSSSSLSSSSASNIQLDGELISLDQKIHVSKPGLHELRINSNDVISFVILDPIRGSSEWGLPPFTPLKPMGTLTSTNSWQGVRLYVEVPVALVEGIRVPVIILLQDLEGKAVWENVLAKLTVTRMLNGMVKKTPTDTLNVMIYRGYTSLVLSESAVAGTAIKVDVSCGPLSQTVTVETWTQEALRKAMWVDVSAGDMMRSVLGRHAVLKVASVSLRIPSKSTLNVEHGALLVLGPAVDIVVEGTLNLNGKYRSPITIISMVNEKPFGTIRVTGSSASVNMKWTIITGGAGDISPDVLFGHHNVRPLFHITDDATLNLHHVDMVQCPFGQTFRGINSTITLSSVLVDSFVTGGQFDSCTLKVDNSAFIRFPDSSSEFSLETAEGDHDAIYVVGGDTLLVSSVFAYAKDDCIDSGTGPGGILKVEYSLIESCFHEGIALSDINTLPTEPKQVSILNTHVLSSGQGIELGFSTPYLFAEVNHVTIENCYVGIRYSDNYGWPQDGVLRVSDSLLINNTKATWNFYRKTFESVEGGHFLIETTISDNEEDRTFSLSSLEIDNRGRLIPEKYLDSKSSLVGSDGRAVGITESSEVHAIVLWGVLNATTRLTLLNAVINTPEIVIHEHIEISWGDEDEVCFRRFYGADYYQVSIQGRTTSMGEIKSFNPFLVIIVEDMTPSYTPETHAGSSGKPVNTKLYKLKHRLRNLLEEIIPADSTNSGVIRYGLHATNVAWEADKQFRFLFGVPARDFKNRITISPNEILYHSCIEGDVARPKSASRPISAMVALRTIVQSHRLTATASKTPTELEKVLENFDETKEAHIFHLSSYAAALLPIQLTNIVHKTLLKCCMNDLKWIEWRAPPHSVLENLALIGDLGWQTEIGGKNPSKLNCWRVRDALRMWKLPVNERPLNISDVVSMYSHLGDTALVDNRGHFGRLDLMESALFTDSPNGVKSNVIIAMTATSPEFGINRDSVPLVILDGNHRSILALKHANPITLLVAVSPNVRTSTFWLKQCDNT